MLVRSQMNMVDEAKLCNPIRSTFEVFFCVMYCHALSCRRIGPILFTNVGCRPCSFQCISLICWAYFSAVMVLLEFRKPWLKWAADHQRVVFFTCSFALGSALAFLLNPTTEMMSASCLIKSSFHCTIRSRNGLLLLYRIREDSNLKWLIFLNLWSAHEAPIYGTFSLFQFASNAQWP